MVHLETSQQAASSEESSEQKADDKADRPRTFEALLALLGPRGPYQLLVLACLSLTKAFPGMVTLSFTFARSSLTAHQCDINASQALLAGTAGLPLECWDSAEATPNQCAIRFNCTGNQSLTAELPCREWQFDRSVFTETVASRFRLVCSDSHLADLAATGFFAGFLVGASLYGVIGDRFGRLPAALCGMLNLTLMTALAAVAPVYWLFAAAMILAGIGNGGMITVLYSAAVEATDSAHRLIWGFTLNQGWTLGIFVLTLVAYLERSYQAQLLWLCAASLPLYLLMLLAGESTRWLVSTGRVARADAAVRRMARLNRTTDKLPTGFTTAELVAAAELNSNKSKASSSGLVDLFRTPGLRRGTLLSWLHWFAASMTYYGISLGASSIGGDVFINMILVSGVELPARFMGMALTICHVGRKTVLYASFALSAVFLAGMVVVNGQSTTDIAAAVALAVLSKLSITVAFDCVWLYYCELFPTVIRSAGVGSGSTMARVGAMLSTQLLPLRAIWTPLPFVIFSIGPLLSCLVIYFLPETVGKDLPETVADGEQFILTGGGTVHCGCCHATKISTANHTCEGKDTNSLELNGSKI